MFLTVLGYGKGAPAMDISRFEKSPLLERWDWKTSPYGVDYLQVMQEQADKGGVQDSPGRTGVMAMSNVNMILGLVGMVLGLGLLCRGAERDLTPSEQKLIEVLGPETPRPILLWPGKPPKAIDNAPPEEVTPEGSLNKVSIPSISVYLAPREKSTGLAIIMCPGGGYGGLAWSIHVKNSAICLVPEGIAVVGLKYRLCNPYPVSKDIQKIAVLDAQRAVRMVRARAAEWNINPDRIGVAGYSAGANLTMFLAGNFDGGDPQSADPIERISSRPDFVVGCATWHWREEQSPFVFRKDSPPTMLVHAINDGLRNAEGKIGGAPIAMPKAIKAQLEQLGVPVKMEIFDDGGHGVGNLIPQRYKKGFPGAQWPKLLVKWLETLPPSRAADHDRVMSHGAGAGR